MKILAFETSCDDTSIALFEDDTLLAMDTASQIKIHNLTGWVVPEVAAREHANTIFDVLTNVLTQSWILLTDIDYLAVTTNPWLLPSLLTGTTVASTLSTVLKIPILPIHHIQAHIFANFLERTENDIVFPLVSLTVSWGHNDIYYMPDMWTMERIGTSWDDAAGEAFDKVAKMMWLWYPGWPIISQKAAEYVQKNIEPSTWKDMFPRVWLIKNQHDFSFSWLKSAVKREVDKRKQFNNWELSDCDIQEISYEFENAVTEVLAGKLLRAAHEKQVWMILLAGWVSANNTLKRLLEEWAKKQDLQFLYPKKNIYSMDNAAMVGILAYYQIQYKQFEHKVWVVKI